MQLCCIWKCTPRVFLRTSVSLWCDKDIAIRISSLPRVQCKVSNSASEVLQEEAVWPWWHQASEVSDLKNMHNFDSKIYNIELLILISLLVKFILMGDSFFVINWMRAFWEHLHSKVCSYARLCKVVLIFKSVNGTPLMSEFHIVRIAKRRVLYRFFKWNLTWNTQVQLWIFLESHSLLFKWRNPFHLRLRECFNIKCALEKSHFSWINCQDCQKPANRNPARIRKLYLNLVVG